MAKTRRARIDAENGHRRITRPRLRIIEAETRRYITVYLQAPSATVKYDGGSREVGCETAIIILHGLRIPQTKQTRKPMSHIAHMEISPPLWCWRVLSNLARRGDDDELIKPRD